MFRKDLQTRLQKIFQMGKTTYLAPSNEFEQNTLFVEVLHARPRVNSAMGGRETAKVEGTLTVFSQDNVMPFGFITKAIERADPSQTAPFLFHDIDVDLASSPARAQNIHERRTSFVFLYDSQFDPNKGSLTEIEFTEDT